MKSGVRSGVRHPLFPSLAPVLAPVAGALSIAIVGTFAELTQAAASGARASRAVFPSRCANTPELTDPERDLLWNLFQVPVYALVLDDSGRVIAFECETQQGLHLQPDITLPGLPETSPCDCGYPGPRVMPEPRAASKRLLA